VNPPAIEGTTYVLQAASTPEAQKEKRFVEEKLKASAYVFTRYTADFFLCIAMLRKFEHKGYMGILGTISGLAGLIPTWKKL